MSDFNAVVGIRYGIDGRTMSHIFYGALFSYLGNGRGTRLLYALLAVRRVFIALLRGYLSPHGHCAPALLLAVCRQ